MACPGSQTSEFGAGVSHLANPDRQNLGSVTLGGSLQAESDRWGALTPHGVLRTATDGSPADTDMGVELGQQSLGNAGDAEQAGQSWDRALMQRAAGTGTDDNTP